MTTKNDDTDNGNIIDAIAEAFDNSCFYGLEYVLDEWPEKTPPSRQQQPINWFDFCEFRD